MSKTRRCFTLIEYVVALALLTLLLSSLFFGYRLLSPKGGERLWKQTLVQERGLYQRLNQIFSTLDPTFFAPTSDGILFSFDRGLSDEPLLSHQVKGKISFDSKTNALLLTIRPKKQSTPTQTYVLCEQITEFSLLYYYHPQREHVIDPEKVNRQRPKEGWQTIWKADYHCLPTQIRMTLNRTTPQQRKITWDFDLTHSILFSLSLLQEDSWQL